VTVLLEELYIRGGHYGQKGLRHSQWLQSEGMSSTLKYPVCRFDARFLYLPKKLAKR